MSLVNTEIKPFSTTAFHNGEFVDVSDADLKGKWSVVFFYPADFTFVCPTELGDLADHYADLQAMGVELASIRTALTLEQALTMLGLEVHRAEDAELQDEAPVESSSQPGIATRVAGLTKPSLIDPSTVRFPSARKVSTPGSPLNRQAFRFHPRSCALVAVSLTLTSRSPLEFTSIPVRSLTSAPTPRRERMADALPLNVAESVYIRPLVRASRLVAVPVAAVIWLPE